MTAPRMNAAPHEAARESVVYAGRSLAGSIVVETKGRVTALDASGKRIGIFENDRGAMAAILRKARETAR